MNRYRKAMLWLIVFYLSVAVVSMIDRPLAFVTAWVLGAVAILAISEWMSR